MAFSKYKSILVIFFDSIISGNTLKQYNEPNLENIKIIIIKELILKKITLQSMN